MAVIRPTTTKLTHPAVQPHTYNKDVVFKRELLAATVSLQRSPTSSTDSNPRVDCLLAAFAPNSLASKAATNSVFSVGHNRAVHKMKLGLLQAQAQARQLVSSHLSLESYLHCALFVACRKDIDGQIAWLAIPVKQC